MMLALSNNFFKSVLFGVKRSPVGEFRHPIPCKIIRTVLRTYTYDSSGKMDRGVPLCSGILMIEIGNIEEVRSNI